jgi:LysM repeat protein
LTQYLAYVILSPQPAKNRRKSRERRHIMASSSRALRALGGLVLTVALIAGCERPAASDAVPTVGPEAASPTPGEFPSTAATDAAANPSPAPVEVSSPTPEPTVASPVEATPIPAATQPPSATATSTATTAPGAGTTYIVQPGDRLFSIGRKFGVNPYSIAQANNIVPPYIIYPGQQLNIPAGGGTVTPPPTGRTHTVAPGDNLFRISLRYGASVQAIAAANNISNVNLIFIGQVLRIP